MLVYHALGRHERTELHNAPVKLVLPLFYKGTICSGAFLFVYFKKKKSVKYYYFKFMLSAEGVSQLS